MAKTAREKVQEDLAKMFDDIENDKIELKECGDCRLCCKLVSVAELEKPERTWCEHSCNKGCAIHEKKPVECVSFNCAWRLGFLPDYLKPNKSKVIIWSGRSNYGDTCYIAIDEFARLKRKVGEYLEIFANDLLNRNGIPVLAIDQDGTRKLMLPPGMSVQELPDAPSE